MIRVAEAEAQKLEFQLNELVRESDARLGAISLCEPLRADAGLNRWLRDEREEAYSDWLAWTLEQLRPLDVLDVLGMTEPEIFVSSKVPFKVERERYIPDGRLDLVLTLDDDSVMIVIEVKKYSAETADTEKQRGYYGWLEKQDFRHRRAFLLVADAAEEKYQNFSRLLWAEVCIRFRRLLPELSSRIGIVKTAMVVAFISAVETNLLDFAIPTAQNDGVDRLFYARTIEHLEKYLGSVTA